MNQHPLKKLKTELESVGTTTTGTKSVLNETTGTKSLLKDTIGTTNTTTSIIDTTINTNSTTKERKRMFTEQEKEILLQDAHCLGFWPWIKQYIPKYGIHSLFVLFGSDPPNTLDQDHLLPLLKSLFEKKIQKRTRLSHLNTLEDVVHVLQTCQRILVVTGAGISVSCGIPDFRSKNGIYSRLSELCI
jgi:hypothetical protein